jgi:hypothetical protein
MARGKKFVGFGRVLARSGVYTKYASRLTTKSNDNPLCEVDGRCCVYVVTTRAGCVVKAGSTRDPVSRIRTHFRAFELEATHYAVCQIDSRARERVEHELIREYLPSSHRFR